MSLCILCINCFQGYWLWTTYQQERQILKKDVGEALRRSLEKRQVEEIQVQLLRESGTNSQPNSHPSIQYEINGRSKRHNVTIRQAYVNVPDDTFAFQVLSEQGMEQFRGMPDTTQAFIAEMGEGGLLIGRGNDHDTTRVSPGLFMIDTIEEVSASSGSTQGLMRVKVDTLARRISTMILSNSFFDGNYEMRRIDSIYKRQLQGLGIETPFRLDTLRQRPILGPPSDTLPGAALRTPWLPLNAVSHLFIRAHFDNPGWLVQKRMLGLFAGSLILLLLTTWCFVYMLQTILTQRKLAEIKNDFINNMAHELRTPMSTVSAAIEAIQHFEALEDRNKTQDYLRIAEGEVQRLNGLVDRVLAMAIEEHRDMVMHMEPTDLPALVQTQLDNQRLRNGKDASFTFESELLDPILLLDPLHIGNAISNLLDNALKYSEPGVRVELSCREQANGVLLSVRDNGWGIDPAYQGQVFERFFRVPQGELHEVKGFGLGLAYVRKVIDKHGGWIRLSSQLGQGTDFQLFLPRL